MLTKADKGGEFQCKHTSAFTQHVGQEDSVITLACKRCIQYIAQWKYKHSSTSPPPAQWLSV